jgi:translation initiation factor 2 gamma subunit (eIF-2gamma)
MLVYNTSEEEIKDPQTGESLGYLDLVRGTGTIIFVQDKISIIETDQKKTYRKRIENSSLGLRSYKSEVVESDELKPFDNAQVGDLVKPI